MARDQFIQAKVTEQEAALIAAAARARGITVAAYVRQSALEHARPPVAAWAYDYGVRPAEVLAQRPRPHYLLQRVSEGLDGEQTFVMFTLTAHDQIAAIPAGSIGQGFDSARFGRKEFVLDGSLTAWFVVRTTARVANGATEVDLVELVLRPDGSRATDAVRRRIRDANDGNVFLELTNGRRITGRVDVTDVGIDACDVRVTRDGVVTTERMTVPYASVVGLGSVVGGAT